MKAIALFFLMLVSAHFAMAGRTVTLDSIGLERRDDKIYILHRVDPGETMYSILQRYKTTADVLRAHNPSFDFNSFRSGQMLRIPYTGTSNKVVEPPKQQVVIEKKDIPVPTGNVPNTSSKRVVGYIVRTGDYIFKIAQTYGTTIERIMELNQMKDDRLSVGQTILIEITQNVSTNNIPEPTKTETKPDEPKEEVPWWAYKPVNEGDKEAKKDDAPSTVTPDSKTNVPTGKRVVSFGEMIQGNSVVESGKLLALHSNARIGTFIKVTNANNGRSAVVKVIGNIPAADASKDVAIKLSKAACDALGIKEAKFQVTLEYND